MSQEVLAWLSKTGVAGVLILALWLFKDRIYFSFGQPPEGVRFRHPADPSDPPDDDAPPVIASVKRKPRRRSTPRPR